MKAVKQPQPVQPEQGRAYSFLWSVVYDDDDAEEYTEHDMVRYCIKRVDGGRRRHGHGHGGTEGGAGAGGDSRNNNAAAAAEETEEVGGSPRNEGSDACGGGAAIGGSVLKPFVCSHPGCGSSFALLKYRTAHEQRQHSIVPAVRPRMKKQQQGKDGGDSDDTNGQHAHKKKKRRIAAGGGVGGGNAATERQTAAAQNPEGLIGKQCVLYCTVYSNHTRLILHVMLAAAAAAADHVVRYCTVIRALLMQDQGEV